tara:strand:- start:215 stop:499 length:285 start_codon:yes stop_codon:yes gene_type:complete
MSSQHVVPGAIFAALMTKRPELLASFKASVEEGQSMTIEDQAYLLDLLADLITQSENDRRSLEQLKQTLANVSRHARGVADSLDTALEDLGGAR